jgi:RNA-directed DNA polymerase
MFDEIAALARELGCEFSLYVDDMSITGVFASRKCQQAARRIIARYGLRAHKAKAFAPGQPRILTGIAKTQRGREIPHRRAKSIAQLEHAEAVALTPSEKLKVLPSLIGKLSEASIVDQSWTGRKNAAVLRRRKLKIAASSMSAS